MRQTPKRKKSIILRLLLLVVCVYMVGMLISEGNELATLKEEEKQLIEKKESLKLSIEEYKELKKDYSAMIEKAARERLGFVYSGEEIYIDISGK